MGGRTSERSKAGAPPSGGSRPQCLRQGARAIRIPLPDRVVRFLGGVAEDAAKWVGKRTMFNRDKALEMTQKGWVCRPDKARERLGWEAQVPLERGMRETAAWYLEHGFL